MTAEQMYVSVTTQLSNSDASRNRSWWTDEVDAAINQEIRAFVARRAANYLAGDQTSAEEVSTLIKRVTTPVYRLGTTKEYEHAVVLPGDFSALLSPVFYGLENCDTQTYTTATVTYYALVPPLTAKGGANYYATFTVSVNGVVVFDITDPAKGGKTGWVGVTDKDDFINLYDHIIWYLQTNVPDFYKDRFRTVSVPNKLTCIQPFTFAIDGASSVATSATTSIVSQPGVSKRFMSTLATPYEIDELLETPYFGRHRKKLFYTYREPVTLLAFPPTGAAIGEVDLAYLRLPAVVSVKLSRNCDLPDNGKVHENICYLAVQSLMGDIGDPKVQLKERQETKVFNNLA